MLRDRHESNDPMKRYSLNEKLATRSSSAAVLVRRHIDREI